VKYAISAGKPAPRRRSGHAPRGSRFLVTALTVAWLWGGPQAGAAFAATFTVDPTQISLSGRTGSALLTLRNESDDTLQFQLSVFAWGQSPSGEMQLEATDDIVFFPTLLTLKPKETRRVRIGSATTQEVREKTYRIFVEELPPTGTTTGSGVRVLTKMGIPIFVRPVKEVATATLNNLRQQDGALRFTLTNAGTVHVVPQSIKVRGLAGSNTAFDRELEGWYVLAGGRREFDMAFPKNACAQVTSIVVDILFESGKLQERLQTPNGACPR
jgi:fimbrial chaperone protein